MISAIIVLIIIIPIWILSIDVWGRDRYSHGRRDERRESKELLEGIISCMGNVMVSYEQERDYIYKEIKEYLDGKR